MLLPIHKKSHSTPFMLQYILRFAASARGSTIRIMIHFTFKHLKNKYGKSDVVCPYDVRLL